MTPPAPARPALAVHARVAARGVDLALAVAPGETVAVLGPNGAGKSTLLGLVAGLVRPDPAPDGTAAVTLFDRRLDGVPPHARGVALLAQDPLLFPHLSVLENVAFAPRSTGSRRRQAYAVAHEQLRAVGAEELADRRPVRLSGGQAQRVAVARALAADPDVLLLDEPMAALDVDVAPALRQTLRRVLAGRTAVIVTHDVLDALLLADRVVVVDRGRVVEDGPTREVLARPRTPFAARLAGHDLLAGRWDGTALTVAGVRVLGRTRGGLVPGGPAVALFSPESVRVTAAGSDPGSGPETAPGTVLPVVVAGLEPVGERVRVRAHGPGDALLLADVPTSAAADLALAPGDPAAFSVPAEKVEVYAAAAPGHGPIESAP